MLLRILQAGVCSLLTCSRTTELMPRRSLRSLAVMSTGLAAEGVPKPEINADEPENRALNLLSSRLGNKSIALSGGTILAIALIANLEVSQRNLGPFDVITIVFFLLVDN